MNRLIDDFLSAAEAAKELGIHIRTLKYWKSLGYGPKHSYMGKRLLYRKSDIKEFLDNLGSEPAEVGHGSP